MRASAPSRTPTLAFCHAGGSSYVFRSIGNASQRLSLQVHDYAGHGRRVRETLMQNWDAIVEDAFERSRGSMTSPYALMGHSMGAMVAVLVARLAQTRGVSPPTFVVLSGSAAPGHEKAKPIGHLPDRELIAELERIGGVPDALRHDPSLIDFFLPIVRSDMRALESWKVDGDWKIDAPFVVLHATDDVIEREHAAAWQARTSDRCLVETLPGGHFSLYEKPEASAEVIDRAVDAILNVRALANS